MNRIKNCLFLAMVLASSSALYTMEDACIILETFSFNKSTKNQVRKPTSKKEKFYNRFLKKVFKKAHSKEELKQEAARQREQQEKDPWAEVEAFIKWHEELQRSRRTAGSY